MHSWLIKLAAREIFYHGTSVARLPTILSQGLNTNYEPIFTEEFRPRDHSIQTYGGIYLTKNLLTAISAGSNANEKHFGQAYAADHILVMAQIETTSPHALIDEDAIPSQMYAIERVFKGLAPNGWWYMQWAANGYAGIDEIVQTYIEDLFRAFHAPEDMDPRFKQNITPLVRESIIAFANREIAITMERGDTWGSYKSQFPEFAQFTVAEWDGKYRQILDVLIHKIHRLTKYVHEEGFFSHKTNIRMTQPVTFRGTNRILCVVRYYSNKSYFEERGKPRGYASELTIEFAAPGFESAIDKLLKDWQVSMGKHFILRSKDGQVFYDNFDQEVH